MQLAARIDRKSSTKVPQSGDRIEAKWMSGDGSCRKNLGIPGSRLAVSFDEVHNSFRVTYR